MRRAGGYAQITDPDRPLAEYDTISCAHCGTIVFTKPNTLSTTFLIQRLIDGLFRWVEEPGAGCRNCMKPICLRCYAKGSCTPLEKWLEQKEGRMQAKRSLLLAVPILLFCLISSAFAQVSPDGTEGPTVTTEEGIFTLNDQQWLFLNGVQIGGFGSRYVKCGSLYVLGTDNNWWKRGGGGWGEPISTKPTCAAPVPTVPVVAASVAVTVGTPVIVVATVDGLRTDYYTISDNDEILAAQTRDITARVNGEVVFTLPKYTAPGTHDYRVAAVNAAGSTSSPPVRVIVQPVLSVPSWACTIPSANSKYANGDLKVTLRCPATFPGVKGNTVTVTK